MVPIGDSPDQLVARANSQCVALAQADAEIVRLRAELTQLRARHAAEIAALLSDVADAIDIVWRGGGAVVRERIAADAAKALDAMLAAARAEGIGVDP